MAKSLKEQIEFYEGLEEFNQSHVTMRNTEAGKLHFLLYIFNSQNHGTCCSDSYWEKKVH